MNTPAQPHRPAVDVATIKERLARRPDGDGFFYNDHIVTRDEVEGLLSLVEFQAEEIEHSRGGLMPATEDPMAILQRVTEIAHILNLASPADFNRMIPATDARWLCDQVRAALSSAATPPGEATERKPRVTREAFTEALGDYLIAAMEDGQAAPSTAETAARVNTAYDTLLCMAGIPIAATPSTPSGEVLPKWVQMWVAAISHRAEQAEVRLAQAEARAELLAARLAQFEAKVG